ncbi:acireductone synthase [Dactylosporangium sp. AC04546]|uniref:acireductone synthase n=1 Tax=Dactylosporangium sp. AC04546 TaxID=2862460 RepID=UPI001EDD4A76|nr:acireductone synthase [Dactylosporangium sp. AC04546]WVK86753.1 acireductone synthase [Dactylosporangium sp. AC04546]
MSRQPTVDAVVLDIEGTTSSLRHLRDRHFPYSRARIPEFTRRGTPEIRSLLDETARIAGLAGATDAELAATLQRWVDEDAKTPPLKTLQGMIWAEAYATGELTSHVYTDVPAALHMWRDEGVRVHTFSSGSVQAQRDWFRHTDHGDLLPLLGHCFDTRTAGPKVDTGSYTAIGRAIEVPPSRILFASDRPAELDAARHAGLRTVGLQRPENPPTDFGVHPWARDLADAWSAGGGTDGGWPR